MLNTNVKVQVRLRIIVVPGLSSMQSSYGWESVVGVAVLKVQKSCGYENVIILAGWLLQK